MNLIFGLGNPGKQYEKTPHNAGFLVLDQIVKILDLGTFKRKFANSFFIKTKYQGKDFILIKPLTYMNNSGLVVIKFKNFYKEKNENLTIIHDDIDLPFGFFKQSFQAGSAGHKGVQSIIDALGNNDFYRLRIGICPDQKPDDLENYVIQKIPKAYENIFFKSINNAAYFILEKLIGFQRVLSRKPSG